MVRFDDDTDDDIDDDDEFEEEDDDDDEEDDEEDEPETWQVAACHAAAFADEHAKVRFPLKAGTA